MITAFGNPVYDYIKTQKAATDGRVLSGCSVNAALVLSRLGEKVRLVGAIGNDYKPAFIKKLAEHDIEPVIIDSEKTGGFSLVYYDNFGNRTLDILGKANDIGKIGEHLYADSKAVLIGPILGEISFETIKEIRKNYKGVMFCDPQGLLRNVDLSGRIIHEKKRGIEEIIGLFDIVKPNELEANVLTGLDCRRNAYKAAEIIKSWGPKIVIITLAELGSVIYDGYQYIDIPPFETDLVDATGAGDTYMAGFTFEYLKTGDLKKSGCFASAVASIMIEQIGPDFVMSEKEIRRRQEILLKKNNFSIPGQSR